MSTAHDRTAAQFDERAVDYRAKYRAPSSLFHLEKLRRLELLVDYAVRLEPRSVLDAGSGPGIALATLRERLPEARLAGVDLSYSMLRQARANTPPSVSLVQTLVERLPFARASFDLVYSLGVTDYLERPGRLFAAVARVLEPGGHFLFTYPNAQSLSRNLRSWSRSLLAPRRNGVSATAISGRRIDAWLAKHGFELVGRHFITYGNGVVFLPWQSVMNERLEDWLDERAAGRWLAWSCLCVARKPPRPAEPEEERT